MAWLPKWLTRGASTEQRGALWTDPYWSNFAAANRGWAASPDGVLSNLAVATRCVGLRSELLAAAPLILYRRTDNGGREPATDHPLYRVLLNAPNAVQSAFEFRELLVRSLDLWGNFFAKVTWNQRGQPVELRPLQNGDVQIDVLPSGALRYRVMTGRRQEIYLADEILHIRNASRDGIYGWSPIQIARGALSLAVAQSSAAQSMAENSFRPSGVISFPGMLARDQRDYLKNRLPEEYGGPANAGKMMIVDGGAKFEKLSFSPEDAQFLEQRRLSNEDTARIFACPPTSVGLVDKATYSNVEMEARNLVTNCLGPLAARIEQALQRNLLTDIGQTRLYIQHDLDALLRGDLKSRYESYRVARESGVLSANDVRRLENQSPIPGADAGGDLYHMPANWTVLGRGITPTNTPAA